MASSVLDYYLAVRDWIVKFSNFAQNYGLYNSGSEAIKEVLL